MYRKRKYLVNFEDAENSKDIRSNPTNFIFYDTETNQQEQIKNIGKKSYKTIINTLKMGWAVYYDSETNETEWIYFEDLKTFYKWLNHVIEITGKKALWIVAHNIVFDNIITDLWEYFNKKKYTTTFIHSKGMSYIHKLQLSYNLKNGKKSIEKNILLVNNGNIFPEKLSNIGETVGFPKLEIDFQNFTIEEMKIYCKRDVEILLEFWKQWIKFIKDNELGCIKFTISGQSMEAFKKKFCEDYIVLDDDLINLEFERKAYYGGRTEIFHKGKVRDKLFYYDVNSMYPYVMRDKQYPIEFKFKKRSPTIDQVEYYLKNNWLLIAEVTLDTKNNAYPLKRDGTLLFPKGIFITYLATPEIIEALKNKDVISFGEVSLYRGSQIFTDYIDFFYNKRVELKLAGNKQEKMYKLFLNSLYGKFGQKMDKWQLITIEQVKEFDPYFDFDLWIMDEYQLPKLIINGENVTPKLRYIGGQLQFSGEEEESNISFPAISAHVTSYARLIIWEAIKYCKKHKIKYYYCDTDSIFTSKELPKDLIDPNKLGKFKLEKMYDYGVDFINLKNYCPLNENGDIELMTEEGEIVTLNETTFLKETKTKIIKGKNWTMKGVSVGAQLLAENKFIMQEWGGLAKQEYYTKFGRKAGEFWVIYKEKENKGIIKKGLLKKNGDIEPFKLNEGK